MVDDQHPIGEGFDIADDVRAEEDGAVVAQRAQSVAKGDDLHGVEAVGRLVEQQDRRVVDQCGGQADALAEAGGALLDALLEHGREATEIDGGGKPIFECLALQSASAGDKTQEFLDAHFLVERSVAGEVADAATHRERVLDRVEVVDQHPTLSGVDKGREHFEHGALTSAVGADEADDFVFVNLEADPIDGGELAVAAGG